MLSICQVLTCVTYLMRLKRGTRLISNCVLDILRTIWLENRNTNITKQLSHIYEAFSNFRLVAQIREEIEKVKPNIVNVSTF